MIGMLVPGGRAGKDVGFFLASVVVIKSAQYCPVYRESGDGPFEVG